MVLTWSNSSNSNWSSNAWTICIWLITDCTSALWIRVRVKNRERRQTSTSRTLLKKICKMLFWRLLNTLIVINKMIHSINEVGKYWSLFTSTKGPNPVLLLYYVSLCVRLTILLPLLLNLFRSWLFFRAKWFLVIFGSLFADLQNPSSL